MPAPVCRSGSWKFTNQPNSRIADGASYLGDSSRYDWSVSYGGEFSFHDDYGLLKMDPRTSKFGTVLSSTNYVWYGNIKATMKTARGAGVVTAFILMSDVKDEVDFEWLGHKLGRTETNYYWQGVKKCKYQVPDTIPLQSPQPAWLSYFFLRLNVTCFILHLLLSTTNRVG
jgi:beta-glucanase (GH16 family)